MAGDRFGGGYKPILEFALGEDQCDGAPPGGCAGGSCLECRGTLLRAVIVAVKEHKDSSGHRKSPNRKFHGMLQATLLQQAAPSSAERRLHGRVHIRTHNRNESAQQNWQSVYFAMTLDDAGEGQGGHLLREGLRRTQRTHPQEFPRGVKTVAQGGVGCAIYGVYVSLPVFPVHGTYGGGGDLLVVQ